MANEPTDRQTRIAAAQKDEPPPEPPRLIEEYEAGPSLLREAVAGMAAEELRLRPVAGKWSTLEVVGCVMSHTDLQGLRRVLLGTRDAHGLYERYGFTPLADPARFLEVFRPGVYEAGQPGGRDRPS